MVNGTVGKANDSLVGTIDNLDVSVLNQFIKTDKMRLGGALSANVQMREMRGNNILLGTAIIRDFEFNEEQFGHLYANAILPSDKNIHFRGALINADYFPDSATVYNYKYSDLANQRGVNTHLNGLFDSDTKQLKVTADIESFCEEIGTTTDEYLAATNENNRELSLDSMILEYIGDHPEITRIEKNGSILSADDLQAEMEERFETMLMAIFAVFSDEEAVESMTEESMTEADL